MPERFTPPSAVIFNERKYPVITEAPTWSQIYGHLRTDDYLLIAGATAAGAPWGYMLGWRYNVARMSSKLGMVLFGSAALAHVTMNSAARLLGIMENSAEVKAILEQPGK